MKWFLGKLRTSDSFVFWVFVATVAVLVLIGLSEIIDFVSFFK